MFGVLTREWYDSTTQKKEFETKFLGACCSTRVYTNDKEGFLKIISFP